MANLYEKVFKKVLTEADEISDMDAMAQTMDTKNTGVGPNDLDAQTADDGIEPEGNQGDLAMHSKHISSMQQRMVGELKGWIGKLDEFSKFLNDPSPNSIQSRLKDSAPDTLFDKIKIAETKKIARVAMEIVSLNEMFKGYLAASNDPKFLGV